MQSDHEKHLQRAKDSKKAAQLSSNASTSQAPLGGVGSEIANMYQSRDLSLKEGETMKINIKRPGSAGSRKPADGAIGMNKANFPSAPTMPPPAQPSPIKQASSGQAEDLQQSNCATGRFSVCSLA